MIILNKLLIWGIFHSTNLNKLSLHMVNYFLALPSIEYELTLPVIYLSSGRCPRAIR